MIIDMENHLFLPHRAFKGKSLSGHICQRYRDASGVVRPRVYQEAASIEADLEFMDKAGIDMAVLTHNIQVLEECKTWHDNCARAIHDHPTRFSGLATINPVGGKPAFDELERAVKGLGLKGVHIFANNDGYLLDSKEMWPFYEKVAELDVPIDVHIHASPKGFEALEAPYPLYYIIAREFDMAANVLRVCLGGVLEEFPDLVFIMNHFGGGVSSVVERIDAYIGYAGEGWPDFYPERPLITRPWREYFKKLYFSMGGREGGLETVKCALTNISPKNLLFGTDWPFNFDTEPEAVGRAVDEIRTLGLSDEEVDGMLGGNAAKLLRL